MIDLIVANGTVVTMDPRRRVLEDTSLAITRGRIVDIGPSEAIAANYQAERSIDATGKAVMPGLIDSHGHSGHALTKTIGHAESLPDWVSLMDDIYFRKTTLDYWIIDGLLGALERVKFGITCGVSVVGSRPRADRPDFAGATAQGFEEVGIRGIVGIGPPGPPWPRIAHPDLATEVTQLSFESSIETTKQVIERWHNAADGSIRVYVSPNYLVPSVGVRDRGIGPLTEDDIRQSQQVMRLAREYDTLVHTHCHGDMVSRAHQGDLEILSERLSVAHCTGISVGDIEILSRVGAAVCHAPLSNRFIRARCPVPELLAAGVRVAIGSDGNAPSRSFDLFEHMRAAISFQGIHFQDPRTLAPGRALAMITIDAARALSVDDDLGSLEIGKSADIITVDLQKPHLVPANMVVHRLVYEATGHDVDTVIVGGAIRMENRKVATVDEAAILANAEVAADRMLSRLDRSALTSLGRDFWG